MTETTLQLRIPASLLQYGLGQDEIQRRLVEWLVISLYTDSHITSGKAARLLNITRVDFLALLRSRGVAYINYSDAELNEEFEAAKALGGSPGS